MNYSTKCIRWVVLIAAFFCAYTPSAFAIGPACSLVVTALPNPQSQTVTVGTTNFDFTHIKLSVPSNCSITVNKIIVGINGMPTSISNLKVFKGATNVQIGTTITTPSASNVVIPNTGITIPAGASITLALKADVMSVGSGQLQLGVKGINAVKTGTNTQVGNMNAYWGKQMTIIPQACTPTVTVLSPNGGEVYTVGQPITITWATSCYSLTPQVAFDLVNGSGNQNTFLFSVTGLPNTGSYTGIVPTNIPTASNYKIRLFTFDPNYQGGGYDPYYKVDSSDTNFTIVNPSVCNPTDSPWVQLLTPNGGEIYNIGGQINFTWSSCNLPQGADIQIIYGALNGFNSYFTIATPNDGQESFVIPSLAPAPESYSATICWAAVPNGPSECQGNAIDVSDGRFLILP